MSLLLIDGVAGVNDHETTPLHKGTIMYKVIAQMINGTRVVTITQQRKLNYAVCVSMMKALPKKKAAVPVVRSDATSVLQTRILFLQWND